MKMPQFFERVGKNRYALIDQPIKGKPVYVWDDKKKCIVPVHPRRRTLVCAPRAKI